MLEIRKADGEPGKIRFTAKNKDEEIGYVSANIEEDGRKVIIDGLYAENNDKYLLDGLCRAILSSAEKEGFVEAEFNLNEKVIKLLYEMKYSEKINLETFFDEKCCGNSL